MDILSFITNKNGATRKEIEEYINLSQTRVITLLKEMLELNLIRKEKDKIDRRTYKYYKKIRKVKMYYHIVKKDGLKYKDLDIKEVW